MKQVHEAPSLADFSISWLATWAVVKLKASAFREYESVVRRHLVPAFGHRRLDAITTEDIQVYVAGKIEAGFAPRTVDNHVIVLKRILGTAVDYGLIGENPVKKVARPRYERPEMRFLAPGQVRELLDAVEPAWRLLIALPVLCGLRKGEVLGLMWDDIDIESMQIRVNKSMRGGIITSPKTPMSISTIPLPESLLPLIERRRKQAGDHELVFSKRDGSPLADATPNRVLERALVAAHFPRVRFHDLRHSWAVAHLRAGTDIKTLTALG